MVFLHNWNIHIALKTDRESTEFDKNKLTIEFIVANAIEFIY